MKLKTFLHGSQAIAGTRASYNSLRWVFFSASKEYDFCKRIGTVSFRWAGAQELGAAFQKLRARDLGKPFASVVLSHIIDRNPVLDRYSWK